MKSIIIKLSEKHKTTISKLWEKSIKIAVHKTLLKYSIFNM